MQPSQGVRPDGASFVYDQEADDTLASFVGDFRCCVVAEHERGAHHSDADSEIGKHVENARGYKGVILVEPLASGSWIAVADRHKQPLTGPVTNAFYRRLEVAIGPNDAFGDFFGGDRQGFGLHPDLRR